MAMKASAIANSNIALVKYWGKRDERLILPQNASISMTADGMRTHTTVEFGKEKKDSVVLNGKELSGENLLQVTRQLDNIRKACGAKQNARVVSENGFPTGAGLASSASGLCALTLAATRALGKNFSAKELSILTRQGSGSACRSVYGGFAEWLRGDRTDGTDSYAVQVANEEDWNEFRMIVAVTSTNEKKVRSRAGMAQTVSSCPLYPGWLESVQEDLDTVRSGIKKKDIEIVGEVAEHNCLKMHATMMSTKPAIFYWLPSTVRVMHRIWEMREAGTGCYFTIDAGPQVKAICLEKDCGKIKRELEGIEGVQETITCKPGEGAMETKEHMF